MVFLQDCCSWVSLLELGRPREGRTLVGREKGRFQRRFWLEKSERPRGREGISVEAVKGDGCFVLMNGGEVAGYGR